MSEGSSSCLWISVPQFTPAPCNRYKHAACAYGVNVYLLGGREKYFLNDFWKYNVLCNKWKELDCNNEQAPEALEEHSMVAHQGELYIFGGLIDSAYSNSKTPLWLFDTEKEKWLPLEEQGSRSQNEAPSNRKGHSAVVLGSFMYIYGGYIDMRGTSQEFWRLDMASRMWTLLSSEQAGPGPRHSHSAVTHQEYMYLYGGLQGLKEQRDLWRWSCHSHTWTCIRTYSGPPKLMGHSAVVYKDSLLLFGGGEIQSAPRSCLWKLNLTTLTWEKLPSMPGSIAPCRIHHCSVGLGTNFQPRPPDDIIASKISVSNPNNRLRPFKNKCFPSRTCKLHLEEGIELDNLHAGKQMSLKDIHLAFKLANGNCLTFENQDVAKDKWDDEHIAKENEDSVQHPMPNLLLILGGKPLKEHAAISVWQMTLGDS